MWIDRQRMKMLRAVVLLWVYPIRRHIHWAQNGRSCSCIRPRRHRRRRRSRLKQLLSQYRLQLLPIWKVPM